MTGAVLALNLVWVYYRVPEYLPPPQFSPALGWRDSDRRRFRAAQGTEAGSWRSTTPQTSPANIYLKTLQIFGNRY